MLNGHGVNVASGKAEGACFKPLEPQQRVRVLLVDDGPHDRLLLGKALRRVSFKCDVEEFSCAQDALNAFRKSPSFDLAVVDYKMPGMDGLSLVAELKSLRKSIVAVLVTGYDWDGLAEKAKSSGCDGFLEKSVSDEYLSNFAAKIEEYLALAKERQLLVDKLGEDFLEKSDAFDGAVFDAAGMSAWEFDRRSGAIKLGRRWLQLLGLDGAEPHSIIQFLRLTHPQDRKAIFEAWRRHSKDPRSDFSIEFRALNSAGAWRWVASSGRAIERDFRGRPLRMLGASRDIDERKKAEDALALEKRKYEWIVNSVGGIVWEADPEKKRFTFISKKAEELLGYPQELWLDEPDFWRNHIHPDDQAWATKLRDEALAAGRSHKLDYRFIAADGHVVWLSSIVNVFMERGRASRVCGVAIDVSARVEMERELKSFSEEMASVNAELLQYSRAVSHDLKSPLRAIHSYASFIQEDLAGSIGPEQRKYFEGLQKAVVEADSLVDGLLRISRVSSHKMEWQPVDLALVVADVMTAIEIRQGARIMQPESWPKIISEPLLLRQILQNLVDNAMKFNKSAERLVWLSWTEARNALKITVEDNGIGIEPADFSRIFGVLERLRPNEFEGTGIGLAIVKRAVQRLSGSIEVSRSPKGGAKFSVALPKKPMIKEPKQVP